jgi:hypothetical protein
LNPDSEIVTQAKGTVSERFPVGPFPRNGWAVTRRPNSGPFNGIMGARKNTMEKSRRNDATARRVLNSYVYVSRQTLKGVADGLHLLT